MHPAESFSGFDHELHAILQRHREQRHRIYSVTWYPQALGCEATDTASHVLHTPYTILIKYCSVLHTHALRPRKKEGFGFCSCTYPQHIDARAGHGLRRWPSRPCGPRTEGGRTKSQRQRQRTHTPTPGKKTQAKDPSPAETSLGPRPAVRPN